MTNKQKADIYISGLLEGGEEIVSKTTGEVYEVNGKLHILFEETYEEDNCVTNNHITLGESEIRVLKKGAISTLMIFDYNMVHNTIYDTQAGRIPMSIKTEKIFKSVDASGIKIDIHYSIELEGVEEVKNRLILKAKYI